MIDLEIIKRIDFIKLFPDEKSSIVFIKETAEISCPHCDCNKLYYIKEYRGGRSKKHPLNQETQKEEMGKMCCSLCRRKFSLGYYSITKCSNISYKKWLYFLYTIYIKKYINTHELGREMGIAQKTSFFMTKRMNPIMDFINSDKINSFEDVVKYVFNPNKFNK